MTFNSLNFDEWMEYHNKNYESVKEKEYRYSIYLNNLKKIDQLNLQHNGTTLFAANKFADKTELEFKKTHLNYKAFNKTTSSSSSSVLLSKDDIPNEIDWTDSNCVTPVRDQGDCGSCWAFSATETIESSICLNKYVDKFEKLSVQQVLDCSAPEGCDSCNGCFVEYADKAIKRLGGLKRSKDYKYCSPQCDQPCQLKAKDNDFVQGTNYLDGYEYTVPYVKHKHQQKDACNQGNTILRAVAKQPISICVIADLWTFYNGGLFPYSTCTDKYEDIDHCIILIGYKIHKKEESDKNYYLAQNSWGVGWGINGRIKLELGDKNNLKNTCSLCSDSTIPLFKKKIK